eukprot:7378885-Prymnesium_polylepis.1
MPLAHHGRGSSPRTSFRRVAPFVTDEDLARCSLATEEEGRAAPIVLVALEPVRFVGAAIRAEEARFPLRELASEQRRRLVDAVLPRSAQDVNGRGIVRPPRRRRCCGAIADAAQLSA